MVSSLNKITPEEKLLHIIENSDKISDNPSQNLSTAKTFGKKFDLKTFPLLNVFTNFNYKKLTLHHVNILLITLALLGTISLVFFLTTESSTLKNRLTELKQAVVKKAPLNLNIEKNHIPDYQEYSIATSSKNPFHMLSSKEPVITKKMEEDLNLKLVGILWTDEPQAIIEDSNSEKTYMVYKGDTIDKYTVTEITQTQVILESIDGNKTLK